MSKNKMSISEVVAQMAEPIAESLGLELWDVKFVKEGPNWYLRVFIDSDEGITIEDCEKMSRALDEPLDALDPIEQSYCLEVCSPGIERELSTDEHLERFIGFEVNIDLIRPDENGNKNLEGVLHSFDKDEIVIDLESRGIAVPRKNISKINLKMTEGEN